MTNPNVTVHTNFMTALGAGDMDGMRQCLHPDITDEQASGHPYAGLYRGPDEFLDMLGRIGAAYEFEALETGETYVGNDSDHLIVELRVKGTAKAGGTPFETTVLEQFKFKDGRIRYVRPFWFDIPR